ncbi:MAG: NADH-quinone oxidoreductase subunit J [Gammaproteobacteria bacterium]|jgi:NADH-quinone oxidoreductase subunit J
MNFTDLVFYFFSAMLVLSGLGVIGSRNPVHSALFLVLSFFSCSALWLLLQAEFLAIVLVLVYVGAVMVLFLFVVMMLNINLAQMRQGFVRYLPIGALVALVMVAQMVWIVGPIGPDVFAGDQLNQAVQQAPEYSNTRELGKVLYTDYVFPFEVASIILLVAIVAAIALTMRRREMTKYQTPGKQVQVRKSDRLRVVKMDAETSK